MSTTSVSDANAATTVQAMQAPGTSTPGATGLPDARKALNYAPAALFSADAWAPLKVELFRSLWIATSIAQIGTWVREAAGPTLMESLTTGRGAVQAEMVARVLVFSNLPIMLLSVFAGALADALDRRRLLIVTQIWMILVSALLGILTLAGLVSPIALLGLTFLLGVGTAAFGPALQAVLPELVPKPQFALAINLNSIALNVARAVGPALFILVVMVFPGDTGAGVSFLLTAASFVGALWVLFRWKRPAQRAAIAGEGILNGIRAGFRYTIHSPANRAILIRVFTFIVPAVVIWSQVPIIATGQLGIGKTSPSAQVAAPGIANATAGVAKAPATAQVESRARKIQQVSALLYAFVGLGAVFGVLLMPGLHARYNIDPVVFVCTLLFAFGLIGLSFVHTLWLAAPILIFLGINWVIIPTNFNTATQKSVPPWVKGRAISFYLTVLFGSFTIGGAIWGRMTAATSIQTSLLVGGIAMALMVLALAPFFPLTLNQGLDLTPAFSKEGPNLFRGHETAPQAGLVRVHAEYAVSADRRDEFLSAMRGLAAQRKRNGVRDWTLVPLAADGHYREVYTYATRAEFDRQPARLTKADIALEKKVAEFHIGQDAVEPVLVAANRIGWRGERIIE